MNVKLVSLIVTLALFHSVAKADRECMATIKAGSGAVEVKDDNTTTLVNPGERFIAVKPWNPPTVTIAFNAEPKVSIQLGISAGMLETN